MKRSRAMILALSVVLGACSGTTATLTPSAGPSLSPTLTPAPTPVPSPTGDPLLTTIRDAAAATVAKDTASFQFEVVFDGSSAVPDGTSFTGEGSLAFSLPRRLAMRADFTTLGVGKVAMIVNDHLLYISGDAFKSLVKPGKWLLVDLSSKSPAAVPFLKILSGQNDTSLVIYSLFAAVGTVVDDRADAQAGTPTHRYTVELDLDGPLDLLPADVRSSMLDNVAALRTGGIDRKIKADVSIGADGLIHRVSYLYTVGTISGGGHLRSSYDFLAFGEPLDLGIPDTSSIVPLEDVLPSPT